MFKIVALYFCLTIFLVSGNGNTTSGVASPALVPKIAEVDASQNTADGVSKEPTDKPAPPTMPPTTTPVPKTTTTPVPKTTTTPAPTTTVTPSPAPKPETTTTTTPKTTTSTQPPVTTTQAPPKPTPAPAPKTGTWVVNGTNETCIVVQMAVQFNVSYETTDNETLWQELTLPAHDNTTNVTGSCGPKEQTLNITWYPGGDYLVVHFTKNDTTNKYSMHHIEVSFGTQAFPNIKPNTTLQFVHDADQFSTKLSNSYRCMRLQKLGLTRVASNETAAYIDVSNLQFQAFKSDKTTGFGAAEDCSAEVPDVVPIAVGCALTILVIIVLAAYLIGRRCSQGRGYVSM